MKILIADDSPTALIQLRKNLDRLGHEVVEARDGLEALERLTEPEAPVMAILDWLMPGLDGPEVCTRIRDLELPVPPYLLLLTMKDTKEDLIEGLSKGANDFVNKPFHEGELNARIQVAERTMALQRALASRIQELEDAQVHIKTLQGILPICSYCHKIRSEEHLWKRLEIYFSDHMDLMFSHGVCPECLERELKKLR